MATARMDCPDCTGTLTLEVDQNQLVLFWRHPDPVCPAFRDRSRGENLAHIQETLESHLASSP